ncbi:MAG: hypothetical protein ABW032_10430 [Burkholderiaceae bacterium]
MDQFLAEPGIRVAITGRRRLSVQGPLSQLDTQAATVPGRHTRSTFSTSATRPAPQVQSSATPEPGIWTAPGSPAAFPPASSRLLDEAAWNDRISPAVRELLLDPAIIRGLDLMTGILRDPATGRACFPPTELPWVQIYVQMVSVMRGESVKERLSQVVGSACNGGMVKRRHKPSQIAVSATKNLMGYVSTYSSTTNIGVGLAFRPQTPHVLACEQIGVTDRLLHQRPHVAAVERRRRGEGRLEDEREVFAGLARQLGIKTLRSADEEVEHFMAQQAQRDAVVAELPPKARLIRFLCKAGIAQLVGGADGGSRALHFVDDENLEDMRERLSDYFDELIDFSRSPLPGGGTDGDPIGLSETRAVGPMLEKGLTLLAFDRWAALSAQEQDRDLQEALDKATGIMPLPLSGFHSHANEYLIQPTEREGSGDAFAVVVHAFDEAACSAAIALRQAFFDGTGRLLPFIKCGTDSNSIDFLDPATIARIANLRLIAEYL